MYLVDLWWIPGYWGYVKVYSEAKTCLKYDVSQHIYIQVWAYKLYYTLRMDR